MNEKLRQRIVDFLDKQPSAMLSVEIAAALNVPVEEVRNELRRMIGLHLAFRHHSTRGVLRYSTRKAGEIIATPVWNPPEVDPGQTMHVVEALHHIAADKDVMRRLNSLNLLGASIAAHLGHALADAESALSKFNREAMS